MNVVNNLAKRASFLEEMHGEQEQFEHSLVDLREEVASLKAYSDPAKIKPISMHIASLAAKIKEASTQSMKFMSRQSIFGEDVAEYPLLQELTKAYQPYADLWRSVEKWTVNRDTWLKSPLSELDAEAIEKEANNLFKTLSKVCRGFENNKDEDMSAQLAVGSGIKDEVNAFRPMLPMLIALRTPGMEDRHWEALSERVGVSVVPDENFTLTWAQDNDLPAQLESINKIAETAAKEFSIKASLDKMSEAWEAVDLAIMDCKLVVRYEKKLTLSTHLLSRTL